jgi:hypothetical protein
MLSTLLQRMVEDHVKAVPFDFVSSGSIQGQHNDTYNLSIMQFSFNLLQ